ncbi:MAG: hemolysin III family protein [Flavobacteriaceae bacterium]|nr:hemolysin III family protein [Flavobacteriaceae bacterium]
MRLQTRREEHFNAATHAIGALLGIAGFILLIIFESKKTNWSLFSVIVYGLSIIILFTASTLYHSVKSEKRKHYFRIVDHISIYLLIAGTYTPVLLITLAESKGWTLFWVVWGFAFIGSVLKLFFTGKYDLVSTLLYLVMGWLIAFDFGMLLELMPVNGIIFLIIGGLFYTVGIVFYVIQRIPYNHVIWHLFVLAGAIFHYFMVFFHVI